VTGRAASGPEALDRNHLLKNEQLDEEGPILLTDAEEFTGECIDA
jgi:hypothetical protein